MIFGFQDLGSDTPKYGFLCIYATWGKLRFLKFELMSVIHFRKFSALHLFLLP